MITASDYDPYTGDTMDMTITVNGWLTWNEVTGVTAWDLVEEMDMNMTSDGETLSANASAHPSGSITVTDSTIAGHAQSLVDETVSYMGMTVRAGLSTTLDLDLDYQVDPFCVTGGWLELEQIWTRRPAGYGEAQLPNQGWRCEWTGCGLFTVAHGS